MVKNSVAGEQSQELDQLLLDMKQLIELTQGETPWTSKVMV